MIYKEARVRRKSPPTPPALLPFFTTPFFTFSKKESRSFVPFLKKQKKDNAKKDKPTHPREAREKAEGGGRRKGTNARPHSKTTLHNYREYYMPKPSALP